MNKYFTIVFFGFIGFLLISATLISEQLEKKLVLKNRVEILLPKGFEIMSGEMLKLKYPSERRPTLVYTDKDGTINVAFNHTTNKATQSQIEAYKNNMVSTFKNLYPSAKWISNGVKVVNGRKVGYMELVTPAIDQKVYNLIFFTDLDGRLLLSTFNCVEKKQKDWQSTAHQIMQSTKIK